MIRLAASLAVVLGLGLLLASATGLAEPVSLQLCTGSPDGNYFASGAEIKRQVQRQNIQVELVETERQKGDNGDGPERHPERRQRPGVGNRSADPSNGSRDATG